MANIKKLSVEKALNELRKADTPAFSRLDREAEVLDEEIARMRAQISRLERLQRKKDK